MLLTMGVRDCPEQAEVYAEVMGVVKSRFTLSHPFLLLLYYGVLRLGYLDNWEAALQEKEFFEGVFGLVDVAAYCYTYNLFRYVLVPTWRSQYPKISFHTIGEMIVVVIIIQYSFIHSFLSVTERVKEQ